MFTGKFERAIDAKKRVVLPPNIKNSLGDVFYLSLSNNKKLEIRTPDEFQKYVDKIDANNQLDPLVQKFKRFIMSSTIKIETDKIGRFLIPEEFVNAIAVKNKVTFVGMGGFIEIWNPEILDKELSDMDDTSIDELTKMMFEKGIKL